MSDLTDPSRLRQLLIAWAQERSQLEKTLVALRGPLVMGWLHVRYTSCQRGNCKCMRGQKHGPFLYASLRLGRRTVQRYVGKPEDQPLVRKIKSYQDFRGTLAKLRKLQRQTEGGWRKLEQGLTEKQKP